MDLASRLEGDTETRAMTERLLLHPSEPDPSCRVLSTGDALSYVALDIVRLEPGAVLKRFDEARECCLVMVAGQGRLAADPLGIVAIGGRESPFDGPGHAAYLPSGTPFTLTAGTPCEIALAFAADTTRAHAARLIPPEDWRITQRGSGNCLREIRDILPETAPASSLLMVEVVTPAGNWSSVPPHKHDTDDPRAKPSSRKSIITG